VEMINLGIGTWTICSRHRNAKVSFFEHNFYYKGINTLSIVISKETH